MRLKESWWRGKGLKVDRMKAFGRTEEKHGFGRVGG